MVALNSHEITTTLVCMANFYLRQLENHSKHFPFHDILAMAMARWWWQSHTHTHIRTCFSTLVSLPFHFVRKIVCCTVHTLTLWNWVLHGQFTESCYIHYIFILLFLSSISLFRLFCPFSHFFCPSDGWHFTIHLCINLEIPNAIVMNRWIFVLILFSWGGDLRALWFWCKRTIWSHRDFWHAWIILSMNNATIFDV